MSGNVGDFMNRFGGGGTIDDREAENFHDRFVSTRSEDNDFDNQTYNQSVSEYLGKLPDEDFQSGARSALSHAPPEERQSMMGGLLGALSGSAGAGGGGLGKIASMLGLGSTDPQHMSEEDGARVMNYARRENPELIRKAVEEKPWFVKAMGNPVVLGALTLAATKLLKNQRRG